MSFLLPVVIYTAGMATTELFIWLYAIFIRDRLKEKSNRKNGIIKHGTYVEVSFWDLGFKSGNLPPIRLNDIWENISNITNGNIKAENISKLQQLLKLIMSEKEADAFIAEKLKNKVKL